MRRTALAMMAAIFAAVFGHSPATADGVECVDGSTWKYCGEHVRGSRLPMKFRVNFGSAPGDLRTADIRAAVRGAAFEWDRHWPHGATRNADDLDGSPGGCDFAPRAVCYDGSTTKGFDLSDDVNSIVWADPDLCPGGDSDDVAVICLDYESSEPGPSLLGLGARIAKADILLNPKKDWRIAKGGDLATGEMVGAFPPLLDYLGSFYDLQSVVTHEFGHALGLEDIGEAGGQWYADLADSDKYTQTMYAYYYPGSTNKRTLDWGDVAGLQRAALDSVQDR